MRLVDKDLGRVPKVIGELVPKMVLLDTCRYKKLNSRFKA